MPHATQKIHKGECDETLHAEPVSGKKPRTWAQGYYYKQVTGDSGSGAKLGDFKGESYVFGPALLWAARFRQWEAHLDRQMAL